jgi:hypothetical protein
LYLVEGLPAGTFTVAVTGVDPAYAATFDVDGLASVGSASVSLADGEKRTDVDFGYAVLASIGDRVWLDANGNGIQDAGEAGVAGFPVSLQGTDSAGNPVSLTTTTDADGNYAFTGLQSGSYTVTFSPAGLAAVGPDYYFVTANAGADDAVDSDGDPVTGVAQVVVIQGNVSNLTVDQGIALAAIDVVKQVCLTGSGCDPVVDAQWGEAARVFPGDIVQWRMSSWLMTWSPTAPPRWGIWLLVLCS